MTAAQPITIDNQPLFSVVAFSGYVDAATAEQARQIAAVQISSGCKNIIVDLTTVEFLDSHGVGFLVSLLKRAHQNGGHLFIAGADGQPAAVLNMVGLNDSLVTYCHDLPEAQSMVAKK